MPLDESQVPTTALEHLGRYQLVGKLGQGGMGAVYLANDTRLDRRVAVKILPPESVHNPDAVARFQREAKALAKLSHPGIVQAFDSEEDNGRHFLVMEYVEGQSLLDVLKRDGRIAPTSAADYIHQAAAALQHAHDKGLVHRDLKPSNLLLSSGGQIKILDLGLARFVQDQIGDPTKTREGMGMGTPDYAAPEQFRDAHRVDGRADIYALGCTLYHLLTGQVPFPGSSLAEKYDAHQKREPTPVEELCPDVPTGLALVVRRMMAKRPADRFQSAAEAADALLPYVAGSAPSAQRFKNTATWDRGQLTLPQFAVHRRSYVPWVVAGTAIAAAVIMLILAWPGLFPRNGEQIAGGPGPADNENGNEAGKGRDGAAVKASADEGPKAEQDPNVLTVSQDKKDGGKFRAISEALAKVDHPGMTIRVLDDATYAEALVLRGRAQYAQLTLESPMRATLIAPAPARMPIAIVQVPGITVRGFRLRADRPDTFCIGIGGNSPGTVLDGLECTANQLNTIGITVEGLMVAKDELPAVIQNCTIETSNSGIQILGVEVSTRQSVPTRGVLIRDNKIRNASVGISVTGTVRDIHIVANRITSCSGADIRMANLYEGSSGILIANNSLKNLRHCLEIIEPKPDVRDVDIRNNLILAEHFSDIRLVGRDQQALSGWRIEHNWRQKSPKPPTNAEAKEWVPATKDRELDRIAVLSQDPSHPDFLRPPADSPLATQGAGKEDPSLPSYVGAVPPAGVPRWDWDRTWRMPRPARLLTVSKEAKDGGKYRSINEALKDAKPWATVRVLDGAAYEDAVILDNPEKQTGISLETDRAATLKWPAGRPNLVSIKSVPDVRISGFRLRALSAGREFSFIRVNGRAAGTTLERLDFAAGVLVHGVVITDPKVEFAQKPVVLRDCTFEVPGDSVTVVGTSPSQDADPISGGVAIISNRVHGGTRGILIRGTLRRVQVAANLTWGCTQSGLQLEDLTVESSDILFANNTAIDSLFGFRVWDNPPYEKLRAGAVEISGNIFLDSQMGDAAGLRDATSPREQIPGDLEGVLKYWLWRCNIRDQSGTGEIWRFPLADRDRKIDRNPFLSHDAADPDFARPAADSPAATGGAGNDDSTLPAYAGAIAPKGVPSWDWDRTWRVRIVAKK